MAASMVVKSGLRGLSAVSSAFLIVSLWPSTADAQGRRIAHTVDDSRVSSRNHEIVTSAQVALTPGLKGIGNKRRLAAVLREQPSAWLGSQRSMPRHVGDKVKPKMGNVDVVGLVLCADGSVSDDRRVPRVLCRDTRTLEVGG